MRRKTVRPPAEMPEARRSWRGWGSAHPKQPLPAAPGIALLDAGLQADAFADEATEGRMVLRDVMTVSPLNIGTLTDAEAMAILRTRLADFTLDLGVPA